MVRLIMYWKEIIMILFLFWCYIFVDLVRKFKTGKIMIKDDNFYDWVICFDVIV